MTLSEFLQARLAEDEAEARAAGTRWQALARYSAHVARHSPARVLAESAAKRAMFPHLMIEDHRLGYCDRCMVLRLLASVYADHPDYRPEWAP